MMDKVKIVKMFKFLMGNILRNKKKINILDARIYKA